MGKMRSFLIAIVGILTVAIVFFGTGVALTAKKIVKRNFSSIATVITNDSTSIDLEGFNTIGESQSGVPGSNTGISDPAVSGTTNQDIENTDATTPSAPVIDTVVITSVSGNSSTEPQSSTLPGTVGQSAGSSSSSAIQTTTENAEEFLATLIGNQAVSVSGTSSGSGASFGASDATIHIDGDAVRRALGARGITEVSFSSRGMRGRLIDRLGSKEDFTLVVASRTLSNAHIDEVILESGTIAVSYRSQGRLFAVIPLNFLVTVAVNAQLETTEKRITVHFPWYKFFLQTYVSKKTLQKELDAAINEIRAEDKVTIDTQARLFEIIVQTLESRFDTTEGSVQKK